MNLGVRVALYASLLAAIAIAVASRLEYEYDQNIAKDTLMHRLGQRSTNSRLMRRLLPHYIR